MTFFTTFKTSDLLQWSSNLCCLCLWLVLVAGLGKDCIVSHWLIRDWQLKFRTTIRKRWILSQIRLHLLNKVAFDSHWAETTQIVLTEHSSRMSIAAIGSYRKDLDMTRYKNSLSSLTMLTKSTVIPCTVMNLHCLSINMHILTVPVVTFTKLLKKIANRHFSHVIFVQKFTVISFFAKVSQPVLADYSPLSPHMAIRAVSTTNTSTTQVKFTKGCFVF